jgi:hypothetical protein
MMISNTLKQHKILRYLIPLIQTLKRNANATAQKIKKGYLVHVSWNSVLHLSPNVSFYYFFKEKVKFVLPFYVPLLSL